jgi:hypothetical protein
MAFECGLSEAEAVGFFPIRDDPAKALLNKSLHGGLPLMSQGANFLKKGVWYLYGCFHMGSHIITYGN